MSKRVKSVSMAPVDSADSVAALSTIEAGILTDIGHRMEQARLAGHLTQEQLAEQTGVSKRTIERLEAGRSVQMSNWIRLCGALNLLDRLQHFLPESGPSPIELIQWHGKQRKRVRSSSSKRIAPAKPNKSNWTWGAES